MMHPFAVILKGRQSGFTLTELLVCVAIMGILLALLFPVLAGVRAKSAGVVCAGNLKLIGAATLQYAGDNEQRLPSYFIDTGDGLDSAGTTAGQWFYNLAPYLDVPRREYDGYSALEREQLGATAEGIGKSCVFTCPAHSKNESDTFWKPNPMTWPSTVPVSYSTSSHLALAAGSSNGYAGLPGGGVYSLRLNAISAPSQKIWLVDSGIPVGVVVDNPARWRPGNDRNVNTLYQGFTRHNQGGNALFFDGHVEWLPLTTFTEPANGSFDRTILRYFAPLRHPEQDQ